MGKTEYEAKFIEISQSVIRKKLTKAGYGCIHERTMQVRAMFTPINSQGRDDWRFLRLRKEPQKTTLTFKTFSDLTATGAEEVEVSVSDFTDMLTILNLFGIKERSYQESYRELWRRGSVEVAIDEWPWLEPYIEVEAASEKELREACAEIGLDWNEHKSGAATDMYDLYYVFDHDKFNQSPKISFDDPKPSFLVPRNKVR